MKNAWWKRLLVAGALGGMTLAGCGDDDESGTDGGMEMTVGMETGTPETGAPETGTPETGTPETGTPETGTPEMGTGDETTFTVRIENVSGSGPIPGPISPGVLLATDAAAPLFTTGEVDRGQGLVAIAEDGAAAELGAAVEGAVVFANPDAGAEPGPAFPGSFYEATVTASPGDALHLATMFVQSNDVFIGPDEAGIPLFDAAGAPISGDITDQVVLWDVGSEANEAPGSGPNQAPRQSGPDIGGAEGAIRLHTAPTHALPAPAAFVGIEVAEAAGEYTFTVTNTAPNSGTLLTPFADVVWALHSTDIEFFTVGGSASPGLEILAEDGGGMAWADELNGVDGVTAGVASSGGPVMGGDSAPAITVTPTMDAPQFSLAAMVVQTNDAFWSTPAVGVALLDEAGAPRPAADIQAEIASVLRIYDAGTEVDEVPGVGVNQAPRQGPPNTGEDEDGEVRRYDGSTGTTNALADLATTGLISVTVETIEGAFVVRVQSNGAGFPGLTPVAWALHSQEVNFFEAGGAATPGLESLAEDGAVDTIVGELAGVEEVDQSGVQAIPDGGSDPAPAMPGGGYTFSVAPTMDGRFLSLASMVIPSNDLFLALGPGGVALLESDGTRRSDEDINADIAAALAVWDAGTEQNQAGAAGSMQARPPFFGGPGGQGGPNMGEAEGNGLVREIPDGVWVYPTAGQVVRITVTPAE